MIPRNRQGAAALLHGAAVAALLISSAVVLAACSGLAASNDEAPAAGPDPAYQQRVANYLRSTFKDYRSYDSFEISEPRWVHALQGWSWLTCVRFQDRGRSRIYALFLQSGKIIDGRYAVETDGCGTQAYAPFGLMTGGLQPLH
ncbi:MAG: hypothetical protein P4L80_19780 [Xanthobacteraceae bacterium]|nr:hypothetical protein [Xanthobacteraceae bacterium]